MSEESKKLLSEVDESKRSLLRKILTGGAAVYVAPMIASFSLSDTFSGTVEAHGGNQGRKKRRCHGGNMGGGAFATRRHRRRRRCKN